MTRTVDAGSIVSEWTQPAHGFVGNCTFRNAVQCVEQTFEGARGKVKRKREKIINHLTSHILSNELSHHHPLTLQAQENLHRIFGTESTVQIYSAGNLPGFLDRIPGVASATKFLKRQDEGLKTRKSKDRIVNNAFDITKIAVDFYRDEHQCNLNQLLATGSDDNSLPLVSVVHFQSKHGKFGALDNAYWDGSKMTYGDGKIFNPLVTEPTVGIHEISHMVTEKQAGTNSGTATGLDYQGDAGGLNEYNSDAAAVAAVQKSRNQTTPEEASFRIGQGLIADSPNDALRDMLDPGNGYRGHKILGDDPQEGYGDYRNWSDKSAETDPHLSSAVGNLWFAKTAIALEVPTWTTMEKIRFQSLAHCRPDCTYPQYAEITIEVAKTLFSHQDRTWQTVANGWREVGVLN